MGNDLNSWRAAIGSFYAETQPIVLRFITSINILLQLRDLLKAIRTYYRFLLKFSGSSFAYDLNIYLAITLTMLILLSGDISENPGPESFSGSLSVLHLNIRSIRNKISYIEDCLSDFDILCFTETHLLDDVDMGNLLIKGYCPPFRKDKSAHSGGILVYVADHIMSDRMINLEALWDETIWIRVKTKREIYFICTIYRQPSSNISILGNVGS